jgi:hypothetical protein
MASPELEITSGDLAKRPELAAELAPHLALVPPGGLPEVVPVAEELEDLSGLVQLAEELKDSVQAQKNVAFLEQMGAKINPSPPVNSSVQINLGKGQEALACSLLYSLEVTGLQDFPSRADTARPDIWEAIRLFLLAQETYRKESLKFSDGRLAIGYDHAGSAVFIENIDGSEHNGLKGAPERLLKTVLTSYDLEAQTVKMRQPLREMELQSLNYLTISLPWDS